MEKGFTHFDQNGNAVMVDVSGKQVTYRTALATGYISVGPEIRKCQKRRCPRRSQSCRDHGSQKNFRADSNVSSAADTEMFH